MDENKNESNVTSSEKKSTPDNKKFNFEKIGDWFSAKYTEYYGEFKKIVWPSKENLMKQTLTVIVISLLFGVYIAILDSAFTLLFSQAVTWLATLTV